MLEKLLIANRGEIACRIIDSARALGYATVAVYSDVDAEARHVMVADEAIYIGPPPATSSYLDGARIIAAARETNADAVHPGYGFLAENADFAASCVDAGVVFVGPPAAAIRAMGDKRRAKQLMREADVPCVPGVEPEDQSDEALHAAGVELGFPLLVKAAAGGGGRGMRRVDGQQQLAAAIASARAEAESAFGSGALLLERIIAPARHVEVQVLADRYGAIVHLGERDCSTQRRHQKVIEEAPAPGVDAALRERIGAAAVAAARSVGYIGAGTVELLLDGAGDFYFLEMNTRLQVEHPVTEMITGLDLVALQLEIAAGRPLGLSQDAVDFSGHAIEARIYAEDPAAGYLPQTGRVLAFEPATGEGLRCDHGLRVGQEITGYYDPLLAKVIAHGRDREQARRRLRRALERTVLLGLRHNKRFLLQILADEVFVAGEMTTAALDTEPRFAELAARGPVSPAALAVAAALWVDRDPREAFRNSHPQVQPLALRDQEGLDGAVHRVALTPSGDGALEGQIGEQRHRVRLGQRAFARRRVQIGERQLWVVAQRERDALHLELEGQDFVFSEELPRAAEDGPASGSRDLLAPTSGRVLAVRVALGEEVEAGQLALTLEAMKMETALRCGVAGTVAELRVGEGQQVERGALLLRIEPCPEGETNSSSRVGAEA